MNNKIKALREEKGLTLEYVAHMSKISIGYVCQLEKGYKDNPSFEIMRKVAKALEEPLYEVFF